MVIEVEIVRRVECLRRNPKKSLDIIDAKLSSEFKVFLVRIKFDHPNILV